MTEHCPHCGQLMPELLPTLDNIKLSPTQRKVVDIIRKCPHGISSEALFERVYGNRSDGGPTSGVRVLHVVIQQANQILRRAKVKIVSTNRSVDSVYMLQPWRRPNRKGERVLSAEQAARIRLLYASHTQNQLARLYHVSQGVISKIVNGKAYA